MSDGHAIPVFVIEITVPLGSFKPKDFNYGRNLLYILPLVPQGKPTSAEVNVELP